MDRMDKAFASLKEYMKSNGGSILLAGPPTRHKTLAEFYKQNPSDCEFIKSFEYDNCKAGIHSFVRMHRTELKITGKKHEKTIEFFESSDNKQQILKEREKKLNDLNDLKASIQSIRVLLDELSQRIDALRDE